MEAATQFASHHRPGPVQVSDWVCVALFRLLHALVAAPSLVFLATLAIMLFRPPDLQLYRLDRIAFVVLAFTVLLRTLLLRRPVRITGTVAIPLFALLLLVFFDLLFQPYEPRYWGTFAAKWVVPFALYCLAQFAFDDAASQRRFESFSLVVLAYLSFISICHLLDAKFLIFPRFILDEGLGIHAERARGPFLQAVANGVTLNMLALLALNAYRRGRLRRTAASLLLLAVPLAILATKTRSVWLSFAGSILALAFLSSSSRIRRACVGVLIVGVLALVVSLNLAGARVSLRDRAAEPTAVEFRVALYHAGWLMFQEKPLLGWGMGGIQQEAGKIITDFHSKEFMFHNSYLEIGVEYGVVGLALYAWMLIDLFRLGRKQVSPQNASDASFLDGHFRSLWPAIVAVYVINASFVVMSYQFVNGYLFTLAGMLAAENRREVQPPLPFH